LWWKLSTVITCGTLGRRDHSGAGQGLHVGRVVPREGSRRRVERGRGVAQHPVGFVAGNFSAYWLGLAIVTLMGIAAYVGVSTPSMGALMAATAVFAFGLVAFGFLGMGPVTIAVDSYGPVTTTRSRSSSSR
jgi:K(+)-stimulated pyrophosphate-energized sodium pump